MAQTLAVLGEGKSVCPDSEWLAQSVCIYWAQTMTKQGTTILKHIESLPQGDSSLIGEIKRRNSWSIYSLKKIRSPKCYKIGNTFEHWYDVIDGKFHSYSHVMGHGQDRGILKYCTKLAKPICKGMCETCVSFDLVLVHETYTIENRKSETLMVIITLAKGCSVCVKRSILMTRGPGTVLGAVTLQASCSLSTFPGTVVSKPEPRERWERMEMGLWL